MDQVSDAIERLILQMLDRDGSAELARNELAVRLGCAPSQITYVLSTRFCVDKGYIVESRRGGGGYVRVMRIDMDKCSYLAWLVKERIGGAIGKKQAGDVIAGLVSMGIADGCSARLMLAAVDFEDKEYGERNADKLRARILRNILISLMQKGE